MTGALDRLEAAAERRSKAEAARAGLEQELALMQEDRARLGDDLERSEAANDRWLETLPLLADRLAEVDALCAALRARVGD